MFFMIGVLNLIEGSLLRVNYLLIVVEIIAFHVLLLDFVDFIVVEIRKQIAVLLVCTMPKDTGRLEHLDLSLDLLFFDITMQTEGYTVPKRSFSHIDHLRRKDVNLSVYIFTFFNHGRLFFSLRDFISFLLFIFFVDYFLFRISKDILAYVFQRGLKRPIQTHLQIYNHIAGVIKTNELDLVEQRLFDIKKLIYLILSESTVSDDKHLIEFLVSTAAKFLLVPQIGCYTFCQIIHRINLHQI